ncbi:hypothetical protein V8E36_005771 [Tilletia maclaganii]
MKRTKMTATTTTTAVTSAVVVPKKRKEKDSIMFNFVQPPPAVKASSSSQASPPPPKKPRNVESIAPTAAEITEVLESAADQERKKRIVLGGDDVGASAAKKEPGYYIAIDCEMVGVGPGGSESVLARVSLVNWHGYTLYDTFVKPAEKVTDYRTWVSGVRPHNLANAPTFAEVQERVAKLIEGRVLVGHAIQHDLKALLLSHPFHDIRDTSAYKGLRDLARTKHPGLRTLAKLVLGIDIQIQGKAHSSVEDARATMAIFRAHKSAWDQSLNRGQGRRSVSFGGRLSASASGLDGRDGEDEGGEQRRGATRLGDKRRAPESKGGPAAKRHASESSAGTDTTSRAFGGKARDASGAGPPFKKKRVVSKPNWWEDPL